MKARVSMGLSARRLASWGMSAIFMLIGAGAARAQMYEPPPPYDYPPVPIAPVPRVPRPAYGPDDYYPPEPDPEVMFRHRRRHDMIVAPEVDDLEGPGPRRRALVPPSPKHEEKAGARRAVAPRPALEAAPARSLRAASPARKIAVTEAPPPQSATRQPSSHERAAAPPGKAAPAVSSAAEAPAPAIATTSRADALSPQKSREEPSRPLTLPMNATEGKSNLDR